MQSWTPTQIVIKNLPDAVLRSQLHVVVSGVSSADTPIAYLYDWFDVPSAGAPLALAMGEGRHHLMAGGFTRPLRGGERIDLRLVVENDRTHTRQVLRVRVPVVGTPGHAAHGEDDLH